MELLDDKAYLEPPDNEAKVVLKCFFCDEDIYESDDYYVLNGFDCCEKCLNVYFKFTAEAPDYDAEIADLEYHERGASAGNLHTKSTFCVLQF